MAIKPFGNRNTFHSCVLGFYGCQQFSCAGPSGSCMFTWERRLFFYSFFILMSQRMVWSVLQMITSSSTMQEQLCQKRIIKPDHPPKICLSRFFRIDCNILVTCAAMSFILPSVNIKNKSLWYKEKYCVNKNYFMQIVDLSMI